MQIVYRLAPPTAIPFGPQNKLLSAAEVQAHNTPSSVWVIINGSVYDVTAFVAAHVRAVPHFDFVAPHVYATSSGARAYTLPS